MAFGRARADDKENAKTAAHAHGKKPLSAKERDILAAMASDSESDDETARVLAREELAAVPPSALSWGDEDDEFMAWLRPYNVRGGVLTIPVYGVLIHKMSFKFGSWATGYAYIRRAFDRGMADPEVHSIVFDHNSPGGMVAGNFELAEHVLSLGWTH